MQKNRTQMEVVQSVLGLCKKDRFQDEIKEKLGLSPQSLKMYTTILVKRGYLESFTLPDDRRIYYTTTTKGLRTYKALMSANNSIRKVMKAMGLRK